MFYCKLQGSVTTDNVTFEFDSKLKTDNVNPVPRGTS